MEHTKRYSARGVSSTKDEVHNAIKMLDKGLYPNAFCKILPDVAAGDEGFCNVLHADTAGTKASLAYIYWKETGDKTVWHGVAQDAIVMNIDDMACVGLVNDFMLSNTITRNKHLIPGEVISAIIEGTVAFCDRMHDLGIEIHNAGGETADVGDIVRTVDVGFTAFGRMRQDKLIVNDIKEGDAIVGFGSFGHAIYEDEYNSGMGSNGLTSARHDVLHKGYAAKYPESYSGETPMEFVYSGSRRLDELIDAGGTSMPLGKLILSPTRTFVPSMRDMFEDLGPKRLHGIIHCTGGGQTKVSHFLPDGLCTIKDNLFATPVLFDIIQKESQADWKEMFQVFNMGVRLEVYVDPADAEAVVQHAKRYNIPAQVIGTVVADDSTKVKLKTQYGEFNYA